MMPAIMRASNQGERLQKVLATLGLGSRRSIEEWIRDGRVTVNGQHAELGVRVGPKDVVAVDGRAVELGGQSAAAASVVLGYHKPVGESRDGVFASPYARRLATQLGFDLARATGSGRHGRIERRDVLAATGLNNPAEIQSPAERGLSDASCQFQRGCRIAKRPRSDAHWGRRR